MNGYLKQSTASQARLIGPFIDDTDFKTAETGLTIANTDIILRANGTTLANKNSGGGTHQANGMYSVTWDATDTANVGELFFSVKVAGALQVFGSYVVLEEAVYDALFGASAAGYQVPIWSSAGATVNLSATTIKTATDVETDTADIQSRIGTPTVSVSADIAGVQSDTNDLQTEVGKIPKSDGTATWNSTALASIQSEANDALIALHLDHLLAADYDPASKPGVATALLNELIESDAGVSRYTANALEQAPSGTGASAASIATAVWQDLTASSDFTTVGSVGKLIVDNVNATISSRASQTSLDTVDDFLDTEIAAIKTKTDLIPAGGFPSNFSSTSISASGLVALTPADHIAIADAILARDIGSGTNALTALDERTVRSALRFIRNKWTVSSGTLTVKTENDSTTAWTSAVTGTAGADPVTANDPT